jgi:5-methylcytosine-specific restriction protein A
MANDDLARFREGLQTVLAEYPNAQLQPLTDHSVARLLMHILPELLSRMVEGSSYIVAGSPGRGNWAETPWVAIFDPLVTDTAQRGFYVVYLLRGDGSAVYLSLGQATTEAVMEHGNAYREHLEAQARAYAALLPAEAIQRLERGPVDLGARGRLSRGYEAGNVVAVRYAADALPGAADLEADLLVLLSLYAQLVQTRDALVDESDPAAVEEALSAGVEAQRERWHRRVERNPRLAREAKRLHGTTCTVCGFNFQQRYGDLGEGFIEAHHLVPLSSLQGRPTQLSPAHDFTVVCSNCHRMLHRKTPPLATLELQRLLRA